MIGTGVLGKTSLNFHFSLSPKFFLCFKKSTVGSHFLWWDGALVHKLCVHFYEESLTARRQKVGVVANTVPSKLGSERKLKGTRSVQFRFPEPDRNKHSRWVLEDIIRNPLSTFYHDYYFTMSFCKTCRSNQTQARRIFLCLKCSNPAMFPPQWMNTHPSSLSTSNHVHPQGLTSIGSRLLSRRRLTKLHFSSDQTCEGVAVHFTRKCRCGKGVQRALSASYWEASVDDTECNWQRSLSHFLNVLRQMFVTSVWNQKFLEQYKL